MSSLHVSVLAIPDCAVSTLSGIYDVLSSISLVANVDDALPKQPPFKVEVVGLSEDKVSLASGLPISPHQQISAVKSTDIIIVPSVIVPAGGWEKDRYPEIIEWLRSLHATGTSLCSACSGAFFLAETGIFDDQETAIHWGYAETFKRSYPNVVASPEKALLVSGERGELVSSGASTSWHDLVLYLVTQHVGPAAAQSVAKFFALQWHRDGLAPYMMFQTAKDHDDVKIYEAQEWLVANSSAANPVAEMIQRSDLAERTFKRRFSKATGFSPINYVQHLRIEDAKRRLERTKAPIDEISWQVGYEEPAFFRRLFKRITGIQPGAYRKKFQLPEIESNES